MGKTEMADFQINEEVLTVGLSGGFERSRRPLPWEVRQARCLGFKTKLLGEIYYILVCQHRINDNGLPSMWNTHLAVQAPYAIKGVAIDLRFAISQVSSPVRNNSR